MDQIRQGFLFNSLSFCYTLDCKLLHELKTLHKNIQYYASHHKNELEFCTAENFQGKMMLQYTCLHKPLWEH